MTWFINSPLPCASVLCSLVRSLSRGAFLACDVEGSIGAGLQGPQSGQASQSVGRYGCGEGVMEGSGEGVMEGSGLYAGVG